MKIIQYYYPTPISDMYRYCMDQVKSMVPKSANYELISDKFQLPDSFKTFGMPWRCSLIRLNLLKNNPDAFFLESDVVINKWFDFEFEQGKSYVIDRHCSSAAIYVNNCPDNIDFLIDRFDGNCIHIQIDRNPDRFIKIPPGYLTHLRLNSLERRGENDECEIKKDSNNKFYISWIKGLKL